MTECCDSSQCRWPWETVAEISRRHVDIPRPALRVLILIAEECSMDDGRLLFTKSEMGRRLNVDRKSIEAGKMWLARNDYIESTGYVTKIAGQFVGEIRLIRQGADA